MGDADPASTALIARMLAEEDEDVGGGLADLVGEDDSDDSDWSGGGRGRKPKKKRARKHQPAGKARGECVRSGGGPRSSPSFFACSSRMTLRPHPGVDRESNRRGRPHGAAFLCRDTTRHGGLPMRRLNKQLWGAARAPGCVRAGLATILCTYRWIK